MLDPLLIKKIYEGLLAGHVTSSDFDVLCQTIEEDEGVPEDFDYFVVHLSDIDIYRIKEDLDFEDKEMSGHIILEKIRDYLCYLLNEPNENTPSAHWKKLFIPSGEEFYLCGLVTVAPGCGVIQWDSVHLRLADFYTSLRNSGYFMSEKDVKDCEDQRLLEYWRKNYA